MHDDSLTGRKRQPRSVARTDGRAIRLTERDRWLLEALGKMRFLTTRQLARLLFAGSRSAANKRLRQLFDARLIRTWVRDLATDNVYALTPAGRAALDDSNDTGAVCFACPRRLDGQLGHLLSLNGARVVFATTLNDGVIAWWQSDWELRRFARRELVPDARFAVHWPDGEERIFALEVEHDTRAPRKFLGKMLRYASIRCRLGGPSEHATLVVGQHYSILERYRQALASVPLSHNAWFTTLAELEQRGANGTIWRPAQGDSRASLRGLTTPPYGTATEREENSAEPRPSAPNAAHTYPLENPTT